MSLLTVLALSLASSYGSLLPEINTAQTVDVKHLLQRNRGELNECASIVNVKETMYLSKTVQVSALSGNAVFRFDKPAGLQPRVVLENAEGVDHLVEGCILRILKKPEFKDQLRDTVLDGRVVVHFDCRLDVERHTWSLDKVEFQCRADWDFYELSAVYPQKVLKVWK